MSPPEIVDEIPEYKAEEILDSHVKKQKLQYLVKWKSYPMEESTWEPSEILVFMYQKHPGAPQ